MDGSFIAIDWGTTNRRAWLLDADGVVVRHMHDDQGVLAIRPDGWADSLAAVRGRLGDFPAIAAGMAGSTRGWVEAPYVETPAGIAELASRLVCVAHARLRIVPGLCRRHPADVMRGEEVQVLGATAAGFAPEDALMCQPGTHNKWVEVSAGRIVGFSTAMTGELFALLRDHSILSDMVRGEVSAGPAFLAGVADAGDDLLASLFGVRAAVLLGEIAPEDAASRASGLLIGADVRARGVAGRTIHVLADARLGALYAAAIAACGGRAEPVDSDRAFLAGIHRIRSLADVECR